VFEGETQHHAGQRSWPALGSRSIPPRVLFTGPRRTTGVNVKVRVAASAVLAAAVTLAASGCTLTAYQATLAHYEPSDGVSASVGSLDIRNILVVSADGSVGNLIMTVINTGTEDVALGVQPGAGGVTQTVRVPAGSTVSLGAGTADAATGGTVSPTSTTHPITTQGSASTTPSTTVAAATGTPTATAPTTTGPSPSSTSTPGSTPPAVPSPAGARKALPLSGFHTQPGDLVSLYFQYGTAEGVITSVPVLDGRIGHYRAFVS